MYYFIIFVGLLFGYTASQAQDLGQITTEAKEVNLTTSKKSQSQFFHFAGKSDLVVTPGMEFITERAQLMDRSGEISESGPISKIEIEYGFTDNFSASLKLGYRDGEQNAPGLKVNKSGMTDTFITLKKHEELSRGKKLHYGGYIGLSPSDTKNTTSRFNLASPTSPTPIETDAHTAGYSLTPYIGYESRVENGVIGAMFIQSVWGTSRKNKITVVDAPIPITPVEVEEEGGGVSDLRFFYEYQSKNFDLGTTFKYRHHTKVEQTKPTIQRVNDRVNLVGLIITPTVKLGPQAEIVTSAAVNYLVEDTATFQRNEVRQGEIIDLSVGGRFTF